jgi:hypothetical protein
MYIEVHTINEWDSDRGKKSRLQVELIEVKAIPLAGARGVRSLQIELTGPHEVGDKEYRDTVTIRFEREELEQIIRTALTEKLAKL